MAAASPVFVEQPSQQPVESAAIQAAMQVLTEQVVAWLKITFSQLLQELAPLLCYVLPHCFCLRCVALPGYASLIARERIARERIARERIARESHTAQTEMRQYVARDVQPAPAKSQASWPAMQLASASANFS